MKTVHLSARILLGSVIAGCATLKDGLELPTDDTLNASCRVRNRGNRLELGRALKTLMIIVQ